MSRPQGFSKYPTIHGGVIEIRKFMGLMNGISSLNRNLYSFFPYNKLITNYKPHSEQGMLRSKNVSRPQGGLIWRLNLRGCISEIRTFLHESTHVVELLVSSVRNEDISIAGNLGKGTDVPSARKCPVRKIFF